MIDEMDLLRMDERQRAAWLLANRATVIAVGLTWIGMIVWELSKGRTPLFLIVMVPVFALFRLLAYVVYLQAAPDSARWRSTSRRIRIVAALLLLVSAFLPLVRLDRGSTAAWQLAVEDWPAIAPVLLAYLWPVAALLLTRKGTRRGIAVATWFAEPLLAAASTLFVLWLPGLFWEFEELFLPWLWIPKSATPGAGAYLAVAANGLYGIGWLTGLFRAGSAAR